MYFCNVSALKNAKLGYLLYAVIIIFLLISIELSSNCRFCLSVFNVTVVSYLSNLDTPYLVESTACKILDVNPFDVSFKHLLRLNPKDRRCDSRYVFTYVTNGILHVNISRKPKQIRHCVIHPIRKHGRLYIFGNRSRKFVSSIAVKDEFFKVKCFNSEGKVAGENFHMQFVKKQKMKSNETNFKFEPILQQTTSEPSMNVLLIMLDSTSRINSLRYLLKTRKFLSETLGAVEMLGYNKVADNTMVNMVPFLTGEFVDSLPCLRDRKGVDNCSVIWKNFSNAGYFTHFAEDWVRTGIFQMNMPGFKEQPTDYFDQPFHAANERGKNGPCTHGKSTSDILHERMFDLASNIKKPLFSLSTHALHTHDSLHGAASLDNSTMKVLSKLYRNNLLNNTFLAVFGDHGMRFGRVRKTFVGQLEERLPMMFIYVPQWFRSKHRILYENLKRNARRLTTHFDMYYTLLHILQLQQKDQQEVKGKGISLLREIPPERSCYDAYIDDHYCACDYDKVSYDSFLLQKKLARALLHEIYRYFNEKNVTQICHLPKLKKIEYSVKIESRGQNKSDTHKIIILTKPGNAVFESTLVFDEISKHYQVVGDISRLDKYKRQSYCVKNAKLKKMCICKKKRVGNFFL